MYTSLLTIGLLVAPVSDAQDGPVWLTSYSSGLEQGQKQGKPVAVFVGSGAQGQAAPVKEGQFSADALKILSHRYVCVYLDRSQSANQRLVRDLGITVAGLVISDRTGNLQAFHQDGAISQSDLTGRLRHFVVSSTVSNTESRLSFYNGSNGQSSTFSNRQYAPVRTVNC